MRQTRITATKVVVRGKKMMKINKIENVYTRAELPTQYFESKPRYSRVEDGVVIVYPAGAQEFIRTGEVLSQERFERMVSAMKQAGDRLCKINRKLAKLRKEWQGKIEVLI